MQKKYSWKTWFLFWFIAILLLTGWYIFLQVKNRNIENLKPFVKIAPIGTERRNELTVLADIFEKTGGFDSEKTFLVLFQNDMELRPGGGFIGSFGILKTKGGKISDIQIHDTGVFDGRISDTETPPFPMGEMLHIKSWKMRDSNWSPDFKTNAEKAEYFYKLGQGGENFDGMIAINTNVLNSFLAITGPVKINDYPGEYKDESAILQLEYQVEKGYQEQGIERGERKSVMKDMAAVLAEKAHKFTLSQQFELSKKIEEHLKRKDIQFYFKDENLQTEVESMNWGGRIKDFSGDYLTVVDANLSSLKSDICMKRSLDYQIDFRGENPQATLQMTYEHTCQARDWMTTDYNDWMRVYVPAGTWYEGEEVQKGEVKIEQDLGKNVFARGIFVPIGKTETMTMKYNFPKGYLSENMYNLMIQKQSGLGNLPVKITITKSDGSVQMIEDNLTEDKVLSF